MIRRIRDIAKHERGTSAVEFAFVAPVLVLLAVGVAKFGLVLNNYLTLTESVATGARYLSLSRGGATPYSTTISQIRAAAISLDSASLTITTRIDGVACGTDTACQTALTSAAGRSAAVSATYPCDLVIVGYNFSPTCTLSSSMTEMIE